MPRLFQLLSHLPLWFLHGLGAIAGLLVHALSPGYRRMLRMNLRTALGADSGSVSPWTVAREAGKAVLETPVMWSAPAERVIGHVVRVSGWELVEAQRSAGRGLVFLTPHLGCFEIVGQFIATRIPIAILYRIPKRAWLDVLMRRGRDRPRMSVWPADLSGVRALMKALRRGEAVGLLPDQVPKVGEGQWLPFFGRAAYTMTLAARLSEMAQIVFVWGERLPRGAGYHLHFSLPSEPLEGDLTARATQINREIERVILARPEQYLWAYNRYKRPPGAPPAPGMGDEVAG